MEKDTKLYKVEIGMLDGKAGDVQNWRSINVLATDAVEAIRKPKLKKHEYIVAVDVIALVDAQ